MRRFKELLDNADPDFADKYTYHPSSSDPYPMPEPWIREPLGDIDTGNSNRVFKNYYLLIVAPLTEQHNMVLVPTLLTPFMNADRD